MLLVKKYANRRLYDTAQSRYITLEELADVIRAGSDVRVVDAKTNEDLTQATLTQIILESRDGSHLLPVALLTRLIRLDNAALGEFLGRYVSWSLDVYLQMKQGPMAAFGAYNPLASAARWMFSGSPWGEPGGPPPAPSPMAAPPPPPPPVTPTPAPEPSSNDVAALRRELEELKDALRAGVGKAATKARRKK